MPKRLPTWDYGTPGFYLVTVCTASRMPWFGRVTDTRVQLTEAGLLARDSLWRLDGWHGQARVDAAVVMPDHVHVLLDLSHARGRSLSLFVRDYKALVTHGCRVTSLLAAGTPLWQRGFHDRIVRNDKELEALRAYIDTNPLRWALERAST